MKNITYQQGGDRSRRERVEEESIEARLYQINCLNHRVLSLRHQAENFGQSDEVEEFITDCDSMLNELRMLGAETETFKVPMRTLNNYNLEELSTITVSAHPVNDVGKCPICIDDFVLGEEVIEMSCHPHHIFHCHCIQPWLQKHSTCPTCRREIHVNKQK
ncbi:uncharacterized protein LOC131043460 [Cryptomeria japonica]|uniref:uncharacterized protein LOC131043460 n=1 Tax=Cryptomeria japonica TaxID=3369 RepID=UPI0025AB6C5B|nr:uncharacterized protein LOC131043460 [Cryptomeria japonica]